jgi:Zn-dependent alcohol dehydrogenase
VTGKAVDAMVDVGCAIPEGTDVNHVGMCLFLLRHFGGDGRIEVDDFLADVNRDKIKELTDGEGVDFSFEAVGVTALMVAANGAARRGGVVCIVGVGSLMESVPFNALMISMEGKSVKGSFYGDANFKKDMPMLLDLYKAGKLNLDDMITTTYKIDEAVQAIDDLKAGKNARGVIVFD